MASLQFAVAAKDQELLEIKQKNTNLEAVVARLEDLLKVSDQKNAELVNQVKEVGAATQRAIQELSSTLEELHEVRTSAESYCKLSEAFET